MTINESFKINESFRKTIFFQSFKQLKKEYLLAVLLDFVYYIIFLITGSFVFFKLFPKMVQLQNALQNVNATETLSMLNSYLQTAKLYSILVVIILFVNYNLMKWLIWKVLLKEKIFSKEHETKTLANSVKELGKFTTINIILWISMGIILYASNFFMMQKFFSYMLILVYIPFFIYVFLFIHPLFMKHKTIKHTLQELFKIVFAKIPHLFPKYLLMVLLFIIWLRLTMLLLFIPQTMYFIIYVALLTIYFNWTKVYANMLLHYQSL